MKTPITLLALFLLCAFSSYLASATLVYDSDGNPLQNGVAYYIVDASSYGGGGLQYVKTGNETCPLTVVYSDSWHSNGYPLNITSSESTYLSNIALNSTVNLAFINPPSCGLTPSEWTVVKGLPEGDAVKLTGYPKIELGNFRIKELDEDSDGYNIEFCAFDIVGHEYTEVCKYVDFYWDRSGNKRLVLTDDEDGAAYFEFEKVSSVSVA